MRWTIFWGVFAVTVCWFPSDWLNDLEARLIPAHASGSLWALAWSGARDYLIHGLLMALVSYSMMRGVSTRWGSEKTLQSSDLDSHRESKNGESGACALPSVKRPDLRLLRVAVVLAVLLFALLIELVQALLPASFERGFGWGDLVASFVGGVMGSLVVLK